MKTYTSAHWGVYEVEHGNSENLRLKPIASDSDPSPIGSGMVDACRDTSVRVKRPSVRSSWLKHGPGSRPELRGQEPFVEVPWDEALDLVAAELDRVRKQFGNQSIFGGCYGWSSAGRFHHAQSQTHRFLNSIGGYVSHKDSYSLGAARVLMPHIVAPMEELMATHTSWDVLAKHTQLFVTFGGVPEKNAQISAGGASPHRIPGALKAMAQAGARFVNISPVRDDLMTGASFDWWPIRPNTDTALLLALAHTLYVDNLHDKAFLEKYCVGFDAFARYLSGDDDGQPKSAEWAAPITAIPAQQIRRLAHEMAQNRTMLNIAWSVQRADHGEQPFWMVVTLAAMLGQIGLPGGGFGVGYGATNMMGSSVPRFSGPTLSQGRNAVRDFIPVARISDMLLNPGAAFAYNGKAYNYPDIQLVYWAGGNPFHHHQDLNRLSQAWRKPATVIVHEPFWTPTAKLADVVLPATTTLERDDIGYSNRERYMVAMKRAMPPVGESRDDYDIFSELARRLGGHQVYTENKDTLTWLRTMYEDCIERAAAASVLLPDFETFWAQGLIDLEPDSQPVASVILLDKFRRDPVQHPLNTPSGKIEIFSEKIAGFNLVDCGGHPQWYEPVEWLGADAASSDELHLISDQPSTRLHSQLDHSPHSRGGKIRDREPVQMHPDEARRRGINDGDIVCLSNARGSCLAAAVLNDGIRPGVVKLSTGAWFDPVSLAGGAVLDSHGNPNVLTRDAPSSELSQGCSAQSCLVRMALFQEPLPPVSAFVAPVFEVR